MTVMKEYIYWTLKCPYDDCGGVLHLKLDDNDYVPVYDTEVLANIAAQDLKSKYHPHDESGLERDIEVMQIKIIKI